MASIDYRLSGDAIFPAAVEDVKTAIRWLRSVANSYNLDPERIGLWGSSSGGHLAALAALSGPSLFQSPDSEHATYSSDVQAVVDGYGPTDFLQMDAQRLAHNDPSEDPESIQLPKDLRSEAANSFESLFLGAPINTCADLVQQANPVTYAKPGAPPFLILHGLADHAVPPQQSELLYEALSAHGNEVTLCLIPGLGHGFFNRNHLDNGGPRKATLRGSDQGQAEQGIFERTLGFFNRHL
jgi:acetyl esterase/lipase